MKYVNILLLVFYLGSCHRQDNSTFFKDFTELRTPIFVYVNKFKDSDQSIYVTDAITFLHKEIGCSVFIVMEDNTVADVFLEDHRNIKDGVAILPKYKNNTRRLADIYKSKRFGRSVYIVRMFANYNNSFQTIIYTHELLHSLGIDHDDEEDSVINASIDINHNKISTKIKTKLRSSYCQDQ